MHERGRNTPLVVFKSKLLSAGMRKHAAFASSAGDIVDLKASTGVAVATVRLVWRTRIITGSGHMNLVTTGLSSRGNAAADEIAFAIGDCDLGKVLVARSSVGICAIMLDSTIEELTQSLATSFRDSRRIPNEHAVAVHLSRIAQFIAAPQGELDFTLDIRGTPFQRRVWDALRTIPSGKSLTYAQLACRISGPKSLRAIAQACAENRIALAIPCHRVMGHSGSMAACRWGAERRRILINREAAAG